MSICIDVMGLWVYVIVVPCGGVGLSRSFFLCFLDIGRLGVKVIARYIEESVTFLYQHNVFFISIVVCIVSIDLPFYVSRSYSIAKLIFRPLGSFGSVA